MMTESGIIWRSGELRGAATQNATSTNLSELEQVHVVVRPTRFIN